MQHGGPVGVALGDFFDELNEARGAGGGVIVNRSLLTYHVAGVVGSQFAGAQVKCAVLAVEQVWIMVEIGRVPPQLGHRVLYERFSRL